MYVASNRWWQFTSLLFLMVGGAGLHQVIAAPVTLYSTQFESAEGFNAVYELADQGGWVGYGTGGNGVQEFYPTYGQSAYVGNVPATTYAGLYLWHPVSSFSTNYPIITFTVKMALVESTNGYRDQFFWSVYNTNGAPLCSLNFFNDYPGFWDIYYDQDNFAAPKYSGRYIPPNAVYSLRMTMNLASNRWDAWLGGVQVVTNALITGTNASRALRAVEAVWLPTSVSGTGNNYMVFDNFTLTADVLPQTIPEVQPPVFLGGGQHRIRVTGQTGMRYALEGSTNLATWAALKTNLIAGTYFDYTNSSGSTMWQFYRARWVP